MGADRKCRAPRLGLQKSIRKAHSGDGVESLRGDARGADATEGWRGRRNDQRVETHAHNESQDRDMVEGTGIAPAAVRKCASVAPGGKGSRRPVRYKPDASTPSLKVPDRTHIYDSLYIYDSL